MTEYLGYEVTALKRIRIINISLDIPMGRYRDLTDAEIKELTHLLNLLAKRKRVFKRGNAKKKNRIHQKDDQGLRKKEIIENEDCLF
jgi:23S rRNA pseudouridine2604 synthase